MNITSLKVFCCVVKHTSFSRAAVENGITQSAVSQSIRQLERHLGVELLNRRKRPFELTEEGLVYYRGAREIVRRYSRLEGEILTMRGQLTGIVRIAAIYSAGISEISVTVERFSKAFENCSVKLSYLHPRKVYEAVFEDEADLGIISYPSVRKGLVALPWRNEPMVVVANPQHPLATRRKVSLDDLGGENFVAFDRELLLRRKIDEFLDSCGIDVNIPMSFDNAETIKRAVELGEGIAILPEPIVRLEVEANTLAIVNLPPLSLERQLGIIFRQDREQFRAAARFAEMLRERATIHRERVAA